MGLEGSQRSQCVQSSNGRTQVWGGSIGFCERNAAIMLLLKMTQLLLYHPKSFLSWF